MFFTGKSGQNGTDFVNHFGSSSFLNCSACEGTLPKRSLRFGTRCWVWLWICHFFGYHFQGLHLGENLRNGWWVRVEKVGFYSKVPVLLGGVFMFNSEVWGWSCRCHDPFMIMVPDDFGRYHDAGVLVDKTLMNDKSNWWRFRIFHLCCCYGCCDSHGYDSWSWCFWPQSLSWRWLFCVWSSRPWKDRAALKSRNICELLSSARHLIACLRPVPNS